MARNRKNAPKTEAVETPAPAPVDTKPRTIDATIISSAQSLVDQLRECDDSKECKKIRAKLRRLNVYGGLMSRSVDVARSNVRSSQDVVSQLKR